jgi:predicted Zn-dependent protease
VADSDTIYRVVLHEMGHALGLGGHSEEPEDIMFGSINGLARGLSERDRDTLKELYSRPIGSRITAAKRGRPN